MPVSPRISASAVLARLTPNLTLITLITNWRRFEMLWTSCPRSQFDLSKKPKDALIKPNLPIRSLPKRSGDLLWRVRADHAPNAKDLQTSMGPRSGDRGEAPPPRSSAHPPTHFNGATVRRPRRGFRGTARQACASHFNGATVRRPRRGMVAGSAGQRMTQTSMGPRSGDRGERAEYGAGDELTEYFNGATVRRPRRVFPRRLSAT